MNIYNMFILLLCNRYKKKKFKKHYFYTEFIVTKSYKNFM